MNKTLMPLFVIIICFLLQSTTVFAAGLDITVGTDSLTYKLGENITISGYVKYSANSQPAVGAVVSLYIDGTYVGQTTANAEGKYKSSPISAGSTGVHTILATAQKSSNTGSVQAYYTVEEQEKNFLVTTDKFIYSPGETVSINVSVNYVTSGGSSNPASNVVFSLKIKTKNGTVVKGPISLTTNSQGMAFSNYTIPSDGYGDYVIIAGEGKAFTIFKVPSFNVETNTIDSNGKERFIYGTSDSLAVRVVVTFQRGNTTQKLPVTNADITAYLKDSEGNTKAVFSNFTESSSGGIYTSTTYSLSNLTNGDYYIETEVSKGSRTQSDKVWFKIKSLKIDLKPVTEKEHVTSFLKNQNITLGIIAINMKTGEELSGEQITGASIIDCKDSELKDCLSELPNRGTLGEGFFEFARTITFQAPNRTGEFLIKIQVNTSTSGSGIGEVYVPVQNIITYAETKDEFNAWRWDFRPGEKVKIVSYAYGENWEEKNISSIQVLEIRNKSWSNIISEINYTINNSEVELTAPNSPGFYIVKIKITTSDGDVGYADSGFAVRLYKIWIDTVDGAGNGANWKWRFGSNDNVYLRLNVFDLNNNRVSSSNLKVSLESLRNEMTGKIYNGLRTTELPADDMDRLGLQISLNGSGATSGFYNAEIKVVDTDGNTDYGYAWFKVSDLDIRVETKDENGMWKWSYSPADNITFSINATYFNQTPVPPNSNASIEALLLMKEGPPISISSDIYATSPPVTLNQGAGSLWLKPSNGKTLPQGFYQALIKVVTPDGLREIQEAWFEVRVINAWSYADPSSVSPNDNVTIRISVTRVDGTPVENATCQLYKVRNAMTWTEVNFPQVPSVTTGTDGVATLEFPASQFNDGDYEAVIRVTSDELGATTESYAWFSVKKYKISAWLVDGSKYIYSPGDTVQMWVRVEYPNSTWQNPQYIPNVNVTVYKFANTENWPWSYVSSVDMVQTEATDPTGMALIKFKAPNDMGTYNPMIRINVSGDVYSSTNPWDSSSFQVRSASVNVRLIDNSTGLMTETDKFSVNSTITVEINVSNPSGGEVNVSSIALKYKNIDSGEETSLQTLSSNLDENNYAHFVAPEKEGDYVLFVTVTDGSTGRPLTPVKRWFKVKLFDPRFWTDKWSYSQGENITVHLDVVDVNDNPVNITVNLTGVRDAWSQTPVAVISEGEKNITGQGEYTFSSPQENGEFEAILCLYSQGSSCTENSQRIYIHFAVESFRIDMWPNSPSFMPTENVMINIELKSGNSFIDPDNYTVNWVDLRDTSTWSNQDAYITEPTESNGGIYKSGVRKIVSFSAENLTTGEYKATLNVTYGSESRLRDVWFKISDAQITIKTIPQVNGHNRDRWFAGETIMLNISINPAENTTGTLRLMDDYSWTEVAVYNFDVVNGNAIVNLTINRTSRYVAIVKIGNAEEAYCFEVGAYRIDMKEWLTEHELKPEDNVTVIFNILNPDGTEYQGYFNVTVNIRNSWDWGLVASNVYNSTMMATNTSDEQITFPHGMQSGEYDAEIIFNIGDKTQTENFWFMVKTNIFEGRSDKNSYMPGETVNIDVFFALPNKTGLSNVNVSIDSIRKKSDWSEAVVNYITRSTLTDSNGHATLNFTLTNTTGELSVKLIGNGTQIAFLDITVSGYDAWVEREANKWSYRPGENFTATLYVFDNNKNPVSNRSVNVKVRREDWSFVESVDINGQTGVNGNFSIKFSLDPGNFTPGHYMLEANIDNGAAIVKDVWFKVETFNTKIETLKEDQSTGTFSHEDQFTQNDTIVIRIEVVDSNWNIIPTNVNATLIEVRDNMYWIDETSKVVLTNIVSSSPGVVDVKFMPINLTTGEYIARINVTANVSGVVSSNIADAWFKISPFKVRIMFECPQGAADNCNPRITTSGGELTARVNISGLYSNFTVCLERIRNLYTGIETAYSGICTNNISIPITFTAPSDEADYDAIFSVNVDGQPYGDIVEWFKVGGNYYMNAWTEPWNVWAGSNVTVWVELWGQNWEDINESQCSFDLTELRNTINWNVLYSNITEWILGPPTDPFGPRGYRIKFTVPPELGAGEYSVHINAVCNGTSISNDAWFRVVAFQVAMLMDNTLSPNQQARMWTKVMSKEGGPIENATIILEKLVDDWTWTTVQTYNQIFTTDDNGEVIINFTAPPQSGRYMLISTIDYNNTRQEIARWFEIKSLNVKIIPQKEKFYEGENIVIYVNVTDPTNNSAPVFNATVNLDIHTFCKNPEECAASFNQGANLVGSTNESGIATFSINTTENNLTSSDLQVWAFVNDPNKGWAEGMKTIILRRYNISVTGTSMEYSVNDNVTFEVTVLNPDGSNPQPQLYVRAGLESMKMTGGNSTELINVIHQLDINYTNFTIPIPSNTSSGPTMLSVVILNDTGPDAKILDEETFMFIVRGTTSSLNFTINESNVIHGGDFVDVNITTDNPNMAMAPFMMHLEKTGEAIPESQLMGGGPGSDKESWYENSIYFDNSGFTHIKILARKQPGNYIILVPFLDKNVGFMSKDAFLDMGVMEYTVS